MKSKSPIEIDNAVFEGIRKTINRFRERPFYYFTEADIHSSLAKDILDGSSDNLIFSKDDLKSKSKDLIISPVSLVHQEYPTNFRYIKKELLNGYMNKTSIGRTVLSYEDKSTKKRHGDRGNFDLAILNPDFVNDLMNKNNDLVHHKTIGFSYEEVLGHIINKDASIALSRLEKNRNKFKKEVIYAIEVKFLHPFNSRNLTMLEEVIRDNKKLMLALKNSDYYIKPINLVFCSSIERVRRDKKTPVIGRIKDYISPKRNIPQREQRKSLHPKQPKIPEGIVNIFIESYLEDGSKKTIKPIVNYHGKETWAKKLFEKLRVYPE